MGDRPTVQRKIDGKEQRRRIFYTNGPSESLLPSCAGADIFRLEESSFVGEARHPDLIRASLKADGSLEFREIVSPSGLHTAAWLLSRALIESAEFSSVLDWVRSVGGNWERALGGLLLVHVPPHYADMVRDRINSFFPTSKL